MITVVAAVAWPPGTSGGDAVHEGACTAGEARRLDDDGDRRGWSVPQR